MKFRAAAVLFLLSGGVLAGDLPDPRLTPGAIDPAVTQQNMRETICVRGYTKTVRPDAAYTNRLKKVQMRQYGYADTNPKHYEEDHLIPLEIGGNPTDERNLWPQPRLSEWSAEQKDQLENALHSLVCSGRLPLAQAQREVAEDWISAWKKYVPGNASGSRRRGW